MNHRTGVGTYWCDCGTLKCENAAICEKVAKCEKNSTLNVKIDAICEQNNAKCEKMRLSKCIKHLIFTNSVKIKFAHISSILTHLESKCLIHLESLIFSHLALFFTYSVNFHI